MLSQPVPSQLGQVLPFLRCQKAAANHGAEKNPSAPVWQAVFSTSHGAGDRILPRLHDPGEHLRVFLGFRSSPSFISWKAFDLVVQVSLKVVLEICQGSDRCYVAQFASMIHPRPRDIRHQEVAKMLERCQGRVEGRGQIYRELRRLAHHLQLYQGERSRFKLHKRLLVAYSPEAGLGRLAGGKDLIRLFEALRKIVKPSFETVPISRIVIEPFRLEIDLVRALHFIAIRLECGQPFGQAVQAVSEPLSMRDVLRIEANEVLENDRSYFASRKECSFIGIRQFGEGHTGRHGCQGRQPGQMPPLFSCLTSLRHEFAPLPRCSQDRRSQLARSGTRSDPDRRLAAAFSLRRESGPRTVPALASPFAFENDF